MRKGFTLIELLAVIVILSIILVIAVPQILKTIKDSAKGAMESDIKLVMNAIKQKMIIDENFNPLNYSSNIKGLLDEFGLNGNNYNDISMLEIEGEYYIRVEGKEKYDGFVACGTYNSIEVTEGECSLDFVAPVITLNGDAAIQIEQGSDYTDLGASAIDEQDGTVTVSTTGTVDINTIGTYTITYTASDNNGNTVTITRTVNVVRGDFEASKGVNRPKLATNMKPIKWDGTNWIETTEDDVNWYDYNSKKWANAKTVDGSMWVWIPRYAYQISSGYHAYTAGTINIKFLQNRSNKAADGNLVSTTPTYSGNQTNYVLHPTFTFGDKILTGIWVAKFEASPSEGVASTAYGCNALDNVTTKTIKIAPNLTAWRCISIGNAFTTSLNMKNKDIVYGWNRNEVDTHMMKNTEWGAVSYLYRSSYGKVNEIWSNPSITTGCAANDSTSNAGPNPGSCLNRFNTANGQQASTTGNVYGIYDMVGSGDEFTSGYITSSAADAVIELISADSKYKNEYSVGTSNTSALNYAANSNKFGDAVYETSGRGDYNSGSWFEDIANMPYSTPCFFKRGGNYATANPYFGIFSFAYGYPTADLKISFRPVLIIVI